MKHQEGRWSMEMHSLQKVRSHWQKVKTDLDYLHGVVAFVFATGAAAAGLVATAFDFASAFSAFSAAAVLLGMEAGGNP